MSLAAHDIEGVRFGLKANYVPLRGSSMYPQITAFKGTRRSFPQSGPRIDSTSTYPGTEAVWRAGCTDTASRTHLQHFSRVECSSETPVLKTYRRVRCSEDPNISFETHVVSQGLDGSELQ